MALVQSNVLDLPPGQSNQHCGTTAAADWLSWGRLFVAELEESAATADTKEKEQGFLE
jgi:hypothetical protein